MIVALEQEYTGCLVTALMIPSCPVEPTSGHEEVDNVCIPRALPSLCQKAQKGSSFLSAVPGSSPHLR